MIAAPYSFLRTRRFPLCILLLLPTAAATGQVVLQEPAAAPPWASQESIRMVFKLPAAYSAAGKIASE